MGSGEDKVRRGASISYRDRSKPHARESKIGSKLAILCAQTWPCVALGANINKDVFTKEELLQLLKEGKGIIHYGM